MARPVKMQLLESATQWDFYKKLNVVVTVYFPNTPTAGWQAETGKLHGSSLDSCPGTWSTAKETSRETPSQQGSREPTEENCPLTAKHP